MTKQSEPVYDMDDGSIDIHGAHPVNKYEKPVTVPEDGDDGMPVVQNEEDQNHDIISDEHDALEKQEIKILTDTEADELKDKQDQQAKKQKKSSADPSDDEEDEDAEGDDDVTKELKRQRNRARRQATKDRRHKAGEYKDNRIRELETKIADLQTKFETSSNTSKLDADQVKIERIRDTSISNLNAAKQKARQAFKDGDDEQHMAALELMYEAQGTFEKASTALKTIDARRKEPVTPAEDGFVVAKRDEFHKSNSWYGGNGDPVDTEIADALAVSLLKKGYRENTEAFWEKMQEMIDDKLPHRSGQQEDEDEDEEPKKIEKKQTAKQEKMQPKKQPISSGARAEPRVNNDLTKISPADLTPMQRSILRQFGFDEGSKEWLEHAVEAKKRNIAARNQK